MQRKGRVAQRCRYLRLCRGDPCPRHSPDLWRRNGHGEKLEGPWDSFLPADATIAHGASGRVPYAIQSGPCGGEQVIHQWRPTLLSPSLQFEMSTRGGAGSTWREGEDARRYLYTAGRVRVVATTPRFPQALRFRRRIPRVFVLSGESDPRREATDECARGGAGQWPPRASETRRGAKLPGIARRGSGWRGDCCFCETERDLR
jgi:hypothetical protein